MINVYWDEPHQNSFTAYLILRTPRSLAASHTVLQSLGKRWAKLLTFDDDETWEDGLVLKFEGPSHFLNLCDAVIPTLNQFDAWILHDSEGNFREGGIGKLANNYFAKSGPYRHSQIFLLFDKENSVADKSQTQIREALGQPTNCLPVMHFRDGIALFYSSEESAKLTFNRISRMARGLQVRIVDWQHETIPNDGVWDYISNLGDQLDYSED